MKEKIKKILDRGIALMSRSSTDKHYKKIMKINSISSDSLPNEQKWVNYWSQFGVKVFPTQYRVFSKYIGENMYTVPEDICHHFIEPVLNPTRYRGYYADKNVFDRLFPKGWFPKTILRRSDCVYFDANYEMLTLSNDSFKSILKESGLKKIIIKPSVDGISGRGVQFFQKQDNGEEWENSNGDFLTLDYLNGCGNNLIIQEAINQSSYIGQFNPTSVNTLRLAVYRSVLDEIPHIIGAVMRIGGVGSVVDNAHAGGCFVGIDKDGSFHHEVMNQYGERQTIFNGIDFINDYQYPNWKVVTKFAKEACKYVPHHRLLALDIVLDKNDEPHLIEFNIEGYGAWVFQFAVGPAFGQYTDEIVKYCKDHQPRLTLKIVER